jgi:hypothetical protein
MSNDKTDSGLILLLASDLMLSSTVSGFASAAGRSFRSALSVDEAVGLIGQYDHCLLLVDLGLMGLDVVELAQQIPVELLTNAVAYGPHVHEEKLAAATAAGFGRVMSRGQFSAQVGRLIADFTPPQVRRPAP